MTYSIKQVSELTGFSAYTLRYYEKEQILPPIQRDLFGNRVYTEEDLELLDAILCLKNTGMPVRQIKTFMRFCMEGDTTLETRKQIVTAHKQDVEEKIFQLTEELQKINEKIQYYTQACQDGTEQYVKQQGMSKRKTALLSLQAEQPGKSEGQQTVQHSGSQHKQKQDQVLG